jgi:hypothetical protein
MKARRQILYQNFFYLHVMIFIVFVMAELPESHLIITAAVVFFK